MVPTVTSVCNFFNLNIHLCLSLSHHILPTRHNYSWFLLCCISEAEALEICRVGLIVEDTNHIDLRRAMKRSVFSDCAVSNLGAVFRLVLHNCCIETGKTKTATTADAARSHSSLRRTDERRVLRPQGRPEQATPRETCGGGFLLRAKGWREIFNFSSSPSAQIKLSSMN